MFGKIAAFEFRYQMRQPLFWAVSLIFFLLAFAITSSSTITIGGSANVHKNAPYAVALDHMVLGIFFMFVTAAFVAGSVLKDDETGFGPIVRTTPLAKGAYLYGRFAGSFAAAALCFGAITLGCIVGGAMPWLDADARGPFLPLTDLYAYGVLGLPSMFLTAGLFFALATVTRSMAWTFAGVIATLVIYAIVSAVTGKPELETAAAPWDPSGLGAYGLATKYWTASERNALSPPLVGALLFNRVLVLALGAAFLAGAYPLFRMRLAPGRAAKTAPEPETAAPPAPAARTQPRFDRRAAWAQLIARTRMDMAAAFKSVVFWVVLVFGLTNAGLGLWFDTTDTGYGGALLPVTRAMIPVLIGAFTFFPLIIAGYYAGDLVWRDRERRMHEIIDATPAPDWSFVIPKILAVALVLIATVVASVGAAVLVQALRGYFHFEFQKYLLWYVLPMAADLTLVAAIGVVLQALSPNKYVGWGLMLLWLVTILTLPQVGVEHRMALPGRPSLAPMSDMNGLGRFWIEAAWLHLYWGAFTVVLAVLAFGVWRRGEGGSYRQRLASLPRRLAGPAGWIGAAALTVMIGVGAFILVNTTVWNEYRTGLSNDAWLADYERALLRYEHTPQPSVTQVTLNVDIHPNQPMIETRGEYQLENNTGQPLREIHVRFARDAVICALAVQGARPTRTYERFNYRIFTFDTPMQPGERRTLSFTTQLTERGFRNRYELIGVVDNGTFVNSFDIAPALGMSRDLLLRDRAARRLNHLKGDLRPAPLGDPETRNVSYIGHAGWTRADITVTTDADQIPLAPGYQVSDVVKDGRRTVHFVTEAPILQFFSIQSARYAVSTETYKGVRLSVYYYPGHAANVPRMLRALEAGLDYDQANFSPYQFRQARIAEFPDYARFAQSFAGTFPWSEGLGFTADLRDPTKVDLVTYVAAHELAHQWWAHQIVGADQQGATSLSETLAQYSALRVMRRLYGPDQIRKFLKYELDRYLRARGGEAVEELPLEKVEDQGYIHYRKGSLVMYRLAEEIGEDHVNAALRALLKQYAFKGPPFPTSLDLVAALRAEAPPDKQGLITDLFEKITLYDLKATAARAQRRADGRWDVFLTVSARKLYADGQGRETPAPMAESLPAGLFVAEPGQGRFSRADVIALERRPIHSGVQTLAFVADRPPKYAGVDPYNMLIDRNSDDNVVAVTR